jgi:hypothetical protein
MYDALNLSGRAMARTGLRMMPTFPSPSLKFRTVGFPQYGFKASMSGATCRSASRRTESADTRLVRQRATRLSSPFARVHSRPGDQALRRQSRRHATISRPGLYTPRLRCAGAPRRPTGPSLLSLPLFPGVPSTIRRWVRGAVPLRVRPSMPGFLALSPSRHPRDPAAASNPRRGLTISARHRSRYAAARLLA